MKQPPIFIEEIVKHNFGDYKLKSDDGGIIYCFKNNNLIFSFDFYLGAFNSNYFNNDDAKIAFEYYNLNIAYKFLHDKSLPFYFINFFELTIKTYENLCFV